MDNFAVFQDSKAKIKASWLASAEDPARGKLSVAKETDEMLILQCTNLVWVMLRYNSPAGLAGVLPPDAPAELRAMLENKVSINLSRDGRHWFSIGGHISRQTDPPEADFAVAVKELRQRTGLGASASTIL